MKPSGISAASILGPALASRFLLCATAFFISPQTLPAQSGPPAAVTSFTPAQGAGGVSLSPTLTWGAAAGATSYDLYFGTSMNPPFVANTSATTYSLAALNPNTTYYWYLVSRNASGTTASFLWFFTTGASSGPPAAVTVFSPAQGATGVPLTVTLTWGAAAGATSYDVYLGTSTSPPFVGNTTSTNFTPAALNPNTTYYWFLVSRNASGTTNSFPWSFTTGTSGHPAFFAGEVSLGSGVYYLQFPNGSVFGYYNYQFFPILYHYDLGFEYFVDAGDGKGGIYLYDFASGHWFYTSPSYPFPYLYDFTLQAILYYDPATNNAGHYTSNPRYFYNFATGKVITM